MNSLADRSVFAGRSHQTDAGDEVLLAAEEIAHNIVDSYSRPPTTFDSAYKLAREGQVDQLRELTEACREERKVMLKNL